MINSNARLIKLPYIYMQVAQSLLQWYNSCLDGDFSMIERLQAVPDGARQSNGVMVRALPSYTMQASMRALRNRAPLETHVAGKLSTDCTAGKPLLFAHRWTMMERLCQWRVVTMEAAATRAAVATMRPARSSRGQRHMRPCAPSKKVQSKALVRGATMQWM